MAFRIEIEGNDFTSSTRGMEEMEITKARNTFIRGLFTKFSSELAFVDEAYNFLNGQLEDLSYRGVLDAVIFENTTGNWVELMTGKLIIADLSWDLTRRITIGNITESTWGAQIQNSKKLKFQLDIGMSKNQVEIDSCTSISAFLLTPVSCSYDDLDERAIYEVRDAFRFLIHAMTDGTVNFISDFFDDQTNFLDTDFLRDIDVWTNVKPYLIKGHHIRDDAQDSAPTISFEELYLAMNASLNLGMQIEDDDTALSGKRLRLENFEFFYQDTSAITLENILDLEFFVDIDKIFSSMKIGNQDYLLDGDYDNTEQFITFREETYIFQGEGNADTELDLTSRYISDTNMIEAQLISTVEDFDERIFIITAGDEAVLGLRHAVRFTKTPATNVNCYYNNNFQNSYTIAQWVNSIPNNVTQYIGSTSLYRARVINSPFGYRQRTITPTGAPQTFLIGFDNETAPFGYDFGNNYSNAVGEYFYTVPFSTLFFFAGNVNMSISTQGVNQIISVTVRTQLKDDNNILIEEVIRQDTQQVSNGSNFTIKIFAFFLIAAVPAVQRVSVSLTVEPISVTEDVSLTVEKFSDVRGNGGLDGGIYQLTDPDGYRARAYEFVSALTMDEWRTIDESETQQMTINPITGALEQRTGWIENIDFTPETGKAKIKLIT